MRSQKEAHNKRIRQVREVLDQQVKLRQELRDKQSKEKEDFEKHMIAQAKKELDIEKQQRVS